MAGILDQKTRFLDTHITTTGKAQIASGKLKAEFYSFSDSGVVYSKADSYLSGNFLEEDVSTKFILESSDTPHDQLTFEIDDSGKLSVKELRSLSSASVKIVAGKVYEANSSSFITSSIDSINLTNELLSSSIDNFKNLYILKSPSVFDSNRKEFELNTLSCSFTITDNLPIKNERDGGNRKISINNLESLFFDKRLSHIPNFKFLPPVNKNSTTTIGNFVNAGNQPILTQDELDAELRNSRATGFSKIINFKKTSKNNRVFGQFFESTANGTEKLDVIDFGLFQTNLGNTKHVFFVGKVLLDDNDSHTFVNLFTIVFF